MSIKQFNEKKQEIIEQIVIGEDYAYDINTNMNDEEIHSQLIKSSIKLMRTRELIKQLQPPKPTCSTCSFYNSYGKENGYCENGVGNNLIFNFEGSSDTMIVDRNFGCIYHSDYEVKDENA